MTYTDKAWLTTKYLDERKTADEMAEEVGVSRPTILYWLKKHDIPRRSTGETLKGKYVGENAFHYGHRHSEEARRRISENHANVSGASNPMFGKPGTMSGKERPETTRRKLSDALRGRQRPEMVGENNPAWKGGRTSLAARIRMSDSGLRWRNEVYARDGYTCQDCGDKTGGNLNAHHIKPLAFLLEEHKITTLGQAYQCVDLWNVTNGVTLCEECHEQRHSAADSVGKVG